MLIRKKCRYDSQGRLIKDKYYFWKFPVLKYILSYPNALNEDDWITAKVHLFGLPLWKNYISSDMLERGSVRGGGGKTRKYTLDASHSMAINIGRTLNEENIESKIHQLCAGLDIKSIKCINTILARLKLTANIKDKKIYNLTQKEKATLMAIEQEFFPNIISLGNCYFYGGFFLPINHFEVSVFYHRHHLNMIKHQERIINKNIIDVGAYIGDSAIVLQNYTRKKVYSFEAVSANYQLMLQTIQLNKASNIVPIQKALGSKSEKLKISLYGAGSSMAINRNQEFEEVEVITLDSFVREHKLEIGFIKVDIEGFEMEFLQGALETIREQKPAMLVSIYHQGSDFFGIKPFLESLDLGYTFKVCKPIDGSVSGETCLFCEVLGE